MGYASSVGVPGGDPPAANPDRLRVAEWQVHNALTGKVYRQTGYSSSTFTTAGGGEQTTISGRGYRSTGYYDLSTTSPIVTNADGDVLSGTLTSSGADGQAVVLTLVPGADFQATMTVDGKAVGNARPASERARGPRRWRVIFVRNLARAWGRSLMTVAGIACGVALFAAISAIARDLQSQMDGAAGQYRLELVISERRATSPMSSRLSAATMAALSARYGEHLAPLVFGTLNERWNPYALVVGAQPRFIERVPVVEGRRPPPGQPALMLGEIAAQRLALAPGARTGTGGPPAGRARRVPRGSWLFDAAVLADLPTAQLLLGREGSPQPYTLAALHIADGRSTDEVAGEIRARHPS